MIEIKNLTKSYGENLVLDNISLNIETGEVISIIGPSGAGKSTFLRCINKLENYQAGEIYIDGKLIGNDTRSIRNMRKEIGMVFQDFNLFPHKTVYENIALGPKKVLKMSKEEIDKTVDELLEKVGLESRKKAYPGELSGGQKQRIAIARALAMKPKAILFDEPTSALDPELVQEVLNVMTDLADEGMTMIVVTHEMRFARDVSSRVVVMADSHIIESGPSKEVFMSPKEERTRQFLKSILNE